MTTTAPIHLTSETAIIPSRYLLYIRSQRCLHCTAETEWTELYAENRLRSRLQAGKYITNIVPVTDFRWNIPIAKRWFEPVYIPACFACEAIDLSYLPTPVVADSTEWQATCARKALEAAKATEGSGGPSSPPGKRPARFAGGKANPLSLADL